MHGVSSSRVPPHSFVLPWAMYALRLPLQGVLCAVYLSSRVSPHSVRLALGYVRFAFALSERLLVIDVVIVNVYDGLKAQ